MATRTEMRTDSSIVALDRFIQSTRDSGYKSTASAIAELVDNSIQAGATQIQILISKGGDNDCPLRVAVVDNGSGMDPDTLVEALRFGGTTRFNSRRGLGRFGMGLPNASMSQSKRVDVFTWQQPGQSVWSYLDVDDVASGQITSIPAPESKQPPAWSDADLSASGTVIVWNKCDRLDNKRLSTLEAKLHDVLGRMFRCFIWDGTLDLSINSKSVVPFDPLFRNEKAVHRGAVAFQEPWVCEVRASPMDPMSPVGKIQVEFVELPVARWHDLHNQEKREMGISNGAGVSVVRGNREVDFGWFFFGRKRKENYDDWWRCEIRFDPVLDELFGITHTKQQIRPVQELKEVLTPYMEEMAKTLSQRARQAHQHVKQTVTNKPLAAEIAAKSHDKLTPVVAPKQTDREQQSMLQELKRRNPVLHDLMESGASPAGKAAYHVVEDTFDSPRAFTALANGTDILTLINTRHALHKKVLAPVAEGKVDFEVLSSRLELLLLAAARAESTFTKKQEKEAVARFVVEWSNSMGVLLSAS